MLKFNLKRLAAVGAASLALAGTVGMTSPLTADAGIPNKVKNVGTYGHIHAEGVGLRQEVDLYPGWSSVRWVISVHDIYAVGEGNCRGKLYLKEKGPDKRIRSGHYHLHGSDNLIHAYVKKGKCGH